jgi:lipopolysaccharide export system protein LptC
MTKKILSLHVIFILAIISSVWLMLHNDSDFTSNQTLKNNMSAFMKDVHYVDYNRDGHIHSKLSADQLIYYSKNSNAYFTNPKIQIYSKQLPSWFISADFGKSKKDLQTIYFWKHVIIHPPSQNHVITTVKTSKMVIYPHQSRAFTKSPVTIVQPGAMIQGVGLEANFKTGVSKILADSRGTYDPKKMH